jgi:hypothetical protein
MGAGRNDPLTLAPHDPDPPIQSTPKYGEGHCGHYLRHYSVDEDKRLVSCRDCGTALDPYEVLMRLAGHFRLRDERLQAAQELERREAVREDERKARAAVRRHRYAPYSYGVEIYCATCGGPKADAIHTGEAEP